jgi:hypothetical protein
VKVVGPCLVFVVYVLLTLLHLAAAAPRVRLDVMPLRTIGPIDAWHVRAWVERDDLNRTLRVEAHADSYDRATELPLNGSFAPRVLDVWWTGRVPCGEYVVAASILGPSRQLLRQTRTRAEICVVAEGP